MNDAKIEAPDGYMVRDQTFKGGDRLIEFAPVAWGDGPRIQVTGYHKIGDGAMEWSLNHGSVGTLELRQVNQFIAALTHARDLLVELEKEQ